MTEIVILIVVVSSIWVAFDAARIGARSGLVKGLADMGPAGWCLACLGIWLVAFPAYLASRPRIIEAVAADRARTSRPANMMRPGMVPCPLCKGPIPRDSIMVGLNTCPHCRQGYEAEALD